MPSAHLLLIEDDPDVVSVMGEELQLAGYRVSAASSVMMGLLQARETSPDLIITDLGLPDGDGSEQGHRKVDEAVKILLTANSGEERLAMKSGFFESPPVGS